MPRHEYRRDNKSRMADEEVTDLENLMETFEENVLQNGENEEELGLRFPQILRFPEPNKIQDSEPIPLDVFSSKKHVFFTERRLGTRNEDEPSSSREESPSTAGDISDSSDSGTDESKNRKYDWNMIQCLWFCIRQLAFSRLWLFLLQFISANYFGDQFRTNAFNLADLAMEPGKSVYGDLVVRKLFAGLRRWDAQHFLFIADNHYIFEHSLAFFPGYPEVINILRLWIQSYMKAAYGWTFQPWIITGTLVVVVNLFFFFSSGIVLFVVTVLITKSVKRGLLACSLFAYSPASIFFSAAYSESMFFTLTLTGFSIMLVSIRTSAYFSRITGAFIGASCFGLSFVIRSNGFLNILYVAWYFCGSLLWESEAPIPEASLLIDTISTTRNAAYRREGQTRLRKFEAKRKMARKVFRWTDSSYSRITLIIMLVFLAFLTIFAFFIPYIFMSNSAVEEFCRADEPTKQIVAELMKKIKFPPKIVTITQVQEKAKWCRKPKFLGLFPEFYGEIQQKYWNVKMFGYWKLKKIPCFLMMLPAAIITIAAIRLTWRDIFYKRRWNNIWILTGRSDHMLPMAIHSAVILATAVFYINAEVFTRLIFSASPFVYVFLAGWIDEMTDGNTPGNRFWHFTSSPAILPFFVFRKIWDSGWRGKLLYLYVLGYFTIGTMAHAAWLPFT